MAGSSGKELGEALGAIFLGIVGGLALASILEALTKPKCPVCKNTVEKGTVICPHCSAWLQWGA
ncbi:MAG TPA: hypothetical protein VGA85_02020 [Dehalococcoidales bacterium]